MPRRWGKQHVAIAEHSAGPHVPCRPNVLLTCSPPAVIEARAPARSSVREPLHEEPFVMPPDRMPAPWMRTFVLLTLGQTISAVGTQLTAFGLGVTILQQTGSVTLFSTVILAASIPGIVVAPLAGMLTDRWNRRLTLLLGHVGAGLCVVGMVVAHHLNALGIGVIIPALMLKAVFDNFVLAAFTSCAVALVPKDRLDRANSLIQLCAGVGQIAAPTLAGLLLPSVGLGGILLIDVATFAYAAVVLVFLRIPTTDPSKERARNTENEEAGAHEAEGGLRGMLRETMAGLAYLRGKRGLVALIALGTFATFLFGSVEILFSPLVLAFGSVQDLGYVESIGGVGLLVGGIALTLLPPARRRVRRLLGYMTLQGAILLIAVAKPSVFLAAIGSFGLLFAFPFTMASGQAIWQTCVPLELQGRVAAVRGAASTTSFAIATLLAGPLADRLFEPAMASGGLLASSLGALLGIGHGRGVALLMAIFGALMLAAVLIARRYRPLIALDEPTSEAGDPAVPVVAQI